MRKIYYLFFAAALMFAACEGEDGVDGTDGTNGEDGADFTPEVTVLKPLTESVVPNTVFSVEKEGVEVEMMLTSQDILPTDSSFVYGSYTDGMALFPNSDDSTYALIVNLERDYSIARIRLNQNLEPLEGDYIVNSFATAFTAQCSGSGVTVEEHGFGPLYLSGGEWGGASKGVFVVDPFKSAEEASSATRLASFGEWSTENAVVLGKGAYGDHTVAFIGDDDSGDYPDGHFAMYFRKGRTADLVGGGLYVLRRAGVDAQAENLESDLYEMGMEEGTAYDVEWVNVTEKTINELNQEAIDSAAIGFQRIEDIDWRRGSAENQRTLFFCVTGKSISDEVSARGTRNGRIYMLQLNDTLPSSGARLTCILDGDNADGIAAGFHSPDNITVTENYVYIQEDPNGHRKDDDFVGWAKLYQYDIANGTLTTVLECDESNEANAIYGGTGKWEITGMIDVTDVIDADEPTFLCGVQVHGWEQDKIEEAVRADGKVFNDPTAIVESMSDLEGSFLFKITGLER